jgi:hypothetical protein
MSVSCKSTPQGAVKLARLESDGTTDGPFEVVLSADEAWSLLDGNRLAVACHEARKANADGRAKEISQLKERLARLEREDVLARTPPRQGGVR